MENGEKKFKADIVKGEIDRIQNSFSMDMTEDTSLSGTQNSSRFETNVAFYSSLIPGLRNSI